MTDDLRYQVRLYGLQLVEDQPPITDDEVLALVERVRELPAFEEPTPPRPSLWVAVGVAITVAMLIGIPLLFVSGTKDQTPATEPSIATTTTVPRVDAATDPGLPTLTLSGSGGRGDCDLPGYGLDVSVTRDGVSLPSESIDYPTFGRPSGGCLVPFDGGGEAVGPQGMLVTRLIGTPSFYPKTWPHAWWSADGTNWIVSDVPVPDRDTGLWYPRATDDGFLVVVDPLDDQGSLEVWRTVNGASWTLLGRFAVDPDIDSWSQDEVDRFSDMQGSLFRRAAVQVGAPALGPVPRFSTTELGDRSVPSSDLDSGTLPDLQSLAPYGLRIEEQFAVGELDGRHGIVLMAWDELTDVEKLCTVIVNPGSGTNWSCGAPEKATKVNSRVSGNTIEVMVSTRNASVSVVALSHDATGTRQWQRPFGGAAMFVIDGPIVAAKNRDFRVTLYDSVGNVIEILTDSP